MPPSKSLPPPAAPPVPPEKLKGPSKADSDLELALLQTLEQTDPWEMLAQLENFHVPDRMRAYDPLVAAVAVRPPSEQDALIAQMRKVLKVNADTVRKAIRAYLESTRGTAEGTTYATPVLITPEWLVEQVYDAHADLPGQRHRYAQWTGKKVEYVDSVEWKGVTYTPIHSKLVEIGCILLPSKAEEYKDDHTLLLEVMHFITKYVDIPRQILTLAASYVLLTWVFDRFTALSYFRAIGDYGSGKTRLIQVTGAVSYRPIMAGGATTAAPVFRLLDRYRGTLIIDEADFSQSDLYSDFIKILNTGYSVGFPVLRAERSEASGGFEPTAYATFGPKILATRAEFKDKALESRMFTHTMNGGSGRQDFPLLLVDSFWEEARALRNKLLLWRFKNYRDITLDPYERIKGVEPRLNQIILPMKAIMRSPKARKVFDEFIAEYQTTMTEDRGLTVEASVARVVIEMRTAHRPLLITTIRDHLKEEDDSFEITTYRLGSLLRKTLGLAGRRVNGRPLVVCTDADLLRLKAKYNL